MKKYIVIALCVCVMAIPFFVSADAVRSAGNWLDEIVATLITTEDLVVTDDATIGDDLAVTGDLTVGGTTELTGLETLLGGAGALTFDSGDASIICDDADTTALIVEDTAGTDLLTFDSQNNGVIASALNVTGIASLDAGAGAATFTSGDASVVYDAADTTALVFEDSGGTDHIVIDSQNDTVIMTALQFVDGGEGAGNLLQSDASGNASWQTVVSGVTLDGAYDFGGAGAGRTITADSDSVVINNAIADATEGLTINRTNGAVGSAALELNADTSGLAINVIDGASELAESVLIDGNSADIMLTGQTAGEGWIYTNSAANALHLSVDVNNRQRFILYGISDATAPGGSLWGNPTPLNIVGASVPASDFDIVTNEAAANCLSANACTGGRLDITTGDGIDGSGGGGVGTNDGRGGDLRITLGEGVNNGADGTMLIRAPLVHGPDAQTIADSGDANPATLTLLPEAAYVELTCNDANTCDITMSEAGAVIQGLALEICNASANVCDFADSAGVLELEGGVAFAMGQYSCLSLRYMSDRWVETSRSAN